MSCALSTCESAVPVDVDGTSASLTPSSRLRLNVSAQNHIQIVSEELEEMMRAQAPTGVFSDLTIIDVREGDYDGGHIRGSVRKSFVQLEENAHWQEFLEEVSNAKVSQLVFVCLNGKQRSPVVAESFLAKHKASERPLNEAPAVYVLTTGFAGFLNRYVDIAADRTIALKADGLKTISEFDAFKWVAVSVPRTPSNADAPSSTQQAVYKSTLDSAHVFVSAREV